VVVLDYLETLASKQLPKDVAFELAKSLRTHSVKDVGVYLVVVHQLTNSQIPDVLKAQLLFSGSGSTVWDTKIDDKSAREKRVDKLKKIAPSVAKKLVYLLMSDSPFIRIAALEHAFALIFLYDLSDKKLSAQVEQQFLYRDQSVRFRAGQLYLAARSVWSEKVVSSILAVPNNMTFHDASLKTDQCSNLTNQTLRSHDQLVNSWKDAKKWTQ